MGGYFWYFAAVGSIWPFAPIYYRELGLSGGQLGIMTALPSLAMALFGPLMGAVADARSIHRLMLCLGLGIAGLAALAATQASSFSSLLPAIGLLAIAAVPIPALLDSHALVIGEHTDIAYGRLRVWGSLGYVVTAMSVGLIVGSNVSAIFLAMYALCLAITLATVIGFPRIAERQSRPLFGSLGILRRNRQLQLLLAVAFLAAIGSAAIGTFLGLRIQDLGASPGLVGGAFALSAVAELPVIAFSGWFLARFGPIRMIAFALIAYCIRFSANSVIEIPELILATQLLHGFTYGGFMIASVTLAHRIAGRRDAATAQTLLSAMALGLGSIVGSLSGGLLLDRIGTQGIFAAAAGLMFITLILFLLGNRVVRLQDAPTSLT